jgi:hypothetical protein
MTQEPYVVPPEGVVDKRKVTMRSVTMGKNGLVIDQTAVDYVRPDFLDAYVADAETRWQSVVVDDEPDAGPAGWHGDTVIPEHLAGKSPEDFAVYGDATTPDHNALDEHIRSQS